MNWMALGPMQAVANGSIRLVRPLGRPSSVFNAVAYGGRGWRGRVTPPPGGRGVCLAGLTGRVDVGGASGTA